MASSENRIIPSRKIVVITAPSGAGKSTIVRKLIQQRKDLAFSISCTTRSKREGEIEGGSYHFISVSDFQQKIKDNEFVEYVEVYQNQFYGTLKTELEKIWGNRKVALFDIDVKGAEKIKQTYKDDALVIFIAPPNQETLFNRLKNRNTEDAASLKKRIQRATEELAYANKFDKIVVNKDFDIAFMNVKNVITNFLKA